MFISLNFWSLLLIALQNIFNVDVKPYIDAFVRAFSKF
jgi:hypothetical protein